MKTWSDGVVESWSVGSIRPTPLLQYSNSSAPRRQLKFIWLALSALLFVLCPSAEAQQPNKVRADKDIK
jgi:hypothetical protein